MSSELRLLVKVMVVPFYKRNAGIFLVAFLLLFGAVSPQYAFTYHLTIMEALAHSTLLLPAAVVWLLYGIRCAHHGLQTLSLPENEFLTYMSLLPVRRQLGSLLAAQVFLYVPIGLYVLVTIGVAVSQQAWRATIIMIVYNFFVCSIITYLFYQKVQYPNKERKLLRFFQYLDRRLTKSYPAFFWYYLLRKETVLLLSTKVFSLFMVAGAILLLPHLNSDPQVLKIGFLLSAFTHVMLVKQSREFEELFLSFTRNFPWAVYKRFGRYTVMYLGVLLPEMVLMAKECFYSMSWVTLLEYTGFALSICLLGHCFLFINSLTTRQYIRRIFFAFVGFYFLIMFKLPLLAIALLVTLLAYYCLWRLYDQYEWIE